MKRVFVDTNILLDVLLERIPFVRPAQIIWSLAERKEIQAAISALSVSNIFFIINKLASREKAYLAVDTLLKIFKISEITGGMISKALAARFPDFEDAVQYFCALKSGARAILTRDPAGYLQSKLPVMDGNEYLALIKIPS